MRTETSVKSSAPSPLVSTCLNFFRMNAISLIEWSVRCALLPLNFRAVKRCIQVVAVGFVLNSKRFEGGFRGITECNPDQGPFKLCAPRDGCAPDLLRSTAAFQKENLKPPVRHLQF